MGLSVLYLPRIRKTVTSYSGHCLTSLPYVLFAVCRVVRVHPRRTKMRTSRYSNTLPNIVILGVESLIIILTNIATVIVFQKRRSKWRQTFLFLMNLTVADLMVDVGLIEDTGQ